MAASIAVIGLALPAGSDAHENLRCGKVYAKKYKFRAQAHAISCKRARAILRYWADNKRDKGKWNCGVGYDKFKWLCRDTGSDKPFADALAYGVRRRGR